jgi:hypothetical protein
LAWPLLQIASNNPYCNCVGYQFVEIKLTRSAKVSWAPIDVQKSKVVTVNKHFSKANKTYKYFVFFANLNKTSFVTTFLARKTIHGHNHNANIVAKHFQMFGMVNKIW